MKFLRKADEIKAGEAMKKLFLSIVILSCLLSFGVFARCDYNTFPAEWGYYYYRYKLRGYPEYRVALERYDFYDIDSNYCGSLSFNPATEEWECFSL